MAMAEIIPAPGQSQEEASQARASVRKQFTLQEQESIASPTIQAKVNREYL